MGNQGPGDFDQKFAAMALSHLEKVWANIQSTDEAMAAIQKEGDVLLKSVQADLKLKENKDRQK